MPWGAILGGEGNRNGGAERPPEEEAMTLSAGDIALMRESFERLQPHVIEASELFYTRLFEIAPELRPLFRSDMTGQGMRFMTTLGVILQHLDDPEALAPYLKRLAEGHAAYGVRAGHFAPMGKALVATMRETLGEEFPEGADRAWAEAYEMLARQMARS